jgi:two-component system response regulator HydG
MTETPASPAPAPAEPPARLLVVDDEPPHRDSLRRIFERAGYDVLVAEDGAAALALLREQPVQLILTDLVMPRMDGLELLEAARTVQPEAELVVMTAYGTVENAVDAMRRGAYDFIAKPIRRGEVLACVERVLEKQRLVSENRQLKAQLAEGRGPQGLIGGSPAMQALVDTVRQVAPSSATILLQGESGTGKEVLAKSIHHLSPRSDGPFVAVNCAALPESILEAELFGAEKGAFTGSVERRQGRFERADGGTLLLDEVGDIPPAMQVKLLRVLQEGEIERLGGTEPVKVDVRVVAATHVDLRELVDQGGFREDLYYRLDVIRLDVPPLRQREGDIPLLAAHFLKKFAEKHAKGISAIEPSALEALASWDFPGNVRELENAIERAVVLCRGEALALSDLPDALREQQPGRKSTEREIIHFRVGQSMAQLEQAAIDATLRHTEGDKKLAARLLGISLRTLYRRLGERESAPPDEDDAG